MILLKNIQKLFTMGNAGILENVDVLIDGKKIVKIDKDIVVDKDVKIIDASNKYVYPGFIDAHCHIGLFEEAIRYEGSDGNEVTNPITPELRAIDAINPMDIAFKEAIAGGLQPHQQVLVQRMLLEDNFVLLNYTVDA